MTGIACGEGDILSAMLTFVTTRRDLAALIVEGRRLVRAYQNDPEVRPATMRSLARVVIEMRKLCATSDGNTDWAGRSREYRDAIGDLFAGTQLDDVERQRLSANLRHHVSQVLHQEAPPEDLERLGINPAPLIERKQQWRRSRVTVPSSAPASDPRRLILSVETILGSVDPDGVRGLTPEVRESLAESLGRSATLARRIAKDIRPK